MSSVRLQGICKRYGAVDVLSDLSLDVAAGEFLTLLGPSGCGKSTLLRVIAGLESQDAGTVTIGTRRVDDLRPKQRDVAMVFQSYALYPHLTVEANLALPLLMRRLSAAQRLPIITTLLPGARRVRTEIAREVAQLAEALEIAHLLARKPGQLSGGQRQRVAVGRAMVRRPTVFLMDEPLSNLDAKLRFAMRAEIKQLHSRLGVTFIYVTHDQAEAMTLSDRVAVMIGGKLLQVASPQAIYLDPASKLVADFVGSPKINLVDGRVCGPSLVEAVGTTLEVGEADALPPQSPITLGIRPEGLYPVDRGGPGIISGQVQLGEHLGCDLYVHVAVLGLREPLTLRLAAEHAPDIRHDQVIHLGVRRERVLAFGPQGERVRGKAANVTRLRSHA
jgi:multiple sugar transport system ATP-binding protein